jgi:hypothetical protein
MISWWEKLFTPSTPFLMTPNSGESIGLAALRIIESVKKSGVLTSRIRHRVEDAGGIGDAHLLL